MLIVLNRAENRAVLTFYHNGKVVNSEISIKEDMNVEKGIKCVVTLYGTNEQIQIVQNPQIPL